MATPPSIGEQIGGAIGKAVGQAIGKEAEKNLTDTKKGKSPLSRRVGYIFAIVFTLLFLWILTMAERWGWPFLTSEWPKLLDLIRLSVWIDIIVYGIFILVDGRVVFYLGKLVTDAVSFYVTLRAYQTFPFDFSGGWNWLDTVVPILLVLGMIMIAVSLVVRTARLASGKNVYD